MNEYTALIMEEIIEHQKCKPPWTKKAEFAQWSYGNWALNTIYESFKTPCSLPYILRVEEFIDLMDKYSMYDYGFSIAYDMGMYIYDLMLTNGDNKRRFIRNEITKH